MNNFKNVVNIENRNNYSNQDNNNEPHKIIIYLKDDFNYLTFRASIYHNFGNDPNYQLSNNREPSFVFNGDIFHNNNNYNQQNQNIFGNNFNNANTNISNANLNHNLNNINNHIYYTNNNNIRQRTRAFSQRNHNNSNLMLNKYNFNPNYDINCYNQNLKNNNINQININQFNAQNNLQMNNLRSNKNDQYKSSFPNKQQNIQFRNNIQNINLQNKFKNYGMNQIDKYLKKDDFDKNYLENNKNIESYNKLKINNNLIDNINNNQNEKWNNININYKANNKEAIIIEQQLNEIKNFSDIAVQSDTTVVIKNSKNSNADINNNNIEKNSENSDVKSNPKTLSNFAKNNKEDPFSVKTIKSEIISNKDESNNNNIKDNNNIINNESESENKIDKNKVNIKNIKQLVESDEDNFHSLATMKSNYSNENLALSNSNELYQDIDYMSEEDLPKEIHNHSFNKKLLNNDLCIICSEKKYFVRGYKCDTCSFILCDICTSLILSGYYSNDRHRHPLVLMEKDNSTKCNICNLNINNYCFHCEECNFTNCINCYIPKINEKIKEKKTEEETERQNLFHEHNLTFLKKVKCIICNQDKNQGYLCEECDFKICFICLNKIFYKIKALKFHQHQLKVRLKYDTICELCNCDLISDVSLFCKKCKKSFCLKCFIKN